MKLNVAASSEAEPPQKKPKTAKEEQAPSAEDIQQFVDGSLNQNTKRLVTILSFLDNLRSFYSLFSFY